MFTLYSIVSFRYAFFMNSQTNQWYAEQIQSIVLPHSEAIKNSIYNSHHLYGEQKIQHIFAALNDIDFKWVSMVASWFGHAIRSIVFLSEIWLALWGSVAWIQQWIQSLVFMMATTCMKDFSKASVALKISQLLDQTHLHALPIRKIPYQKEHFTIQDGKLILTNDIIRSLLQPTSWKCPAVWIVLTDSTQTGMQKKQLITFLLEAITQSYILTTTNTTNMKQSK